MNHKISTELRNVRTMSILRSTLYLLSILLIASVAVGQIDANNNKIEDSLESGITTTADTNVDVIVLYNQTRDAPPAGSKVKYNYSIINATALSIPRSRLHELTDDPHVEMVYQDRIVHAYLDSSVPVISADLARTTCNLTGSNITIAILDTGIDDTHESLDDLDDDPATDDPKVIAFRDFIGLKTEPYDDNGHGTHCAGIAAGTGGVDNRYVGVAPGANLVGVKVLDKNGKGSESNATAGIEWCIENKDTYGIRIISISLGCDGNNDGTTLLERACDAAVDSGIVVCVAAGNKGGGSMTVGNPACAKKVITVGSVDDSMVIASNSLGGPTADGRIKPEVCAVGVNVTSAAAGGGYETRYGTSMAAPHVAGVAALILEYNPNLFPSKVRGILMNTATDRGSPGPDNSYGWGVVNTTYAISAQEHDISIAEIRAQHHTEPDRTVAIDAIIRNTGLSNESDVMISLMLNETVLNQTTIPFIRRSQSVDVNFSWIPNTTGLYNLSVNVSPVNGEILLYDNVCYTEIDVSYSPNIRIAPANYDFTLSHGTSAMVNLTISNTGTLPLILFRITELVNYTIKPIPYNWIDGVSEGTDLKLDDDNISSQNLPFAFNFYGRNYTSINISSDGWASFTSDEKWRDWMYNRGQRLPVDGWENTIFPLGSDWDPGAGGGVYLKSYPQKYVITWYQVPHWSDGGSTGNNTFEMVLYETGEIGFNYMNIENPGAFTVGINLGDGSHGIVYEDEPQSMTSLWFGPERWLSIGAKNGTVAGGGELNIPIVINTADLDRGRYRADILIRSNDPDESSITIPVNLSVQWSAADAAIALRFAVRGEYEEFVDVNKDGKITSLDALMILQAAVGDVEL
ncbi:MAG: S8 family serine peptidase [Euryarchaeota archaeon]|nr:S8 family serine peptidase [Euryarchaeota archaeon]